MKDALKHETYISPSPPSPAAVYAAAGWLSRSFWLWLNPLLSKGSKNPLHLADIPTLSPNHCPAATQRLFQSKPAGKLWKTLLRCFWRALVVTAVLAVGQLCFMLVGPVLIGRFVQFTAGHRSSRYEGYYLVAGLFASKAAEVFCSHHYNFQAQKLGLLVRSALTTAVYDKGLTLTSSERRAHGVGKIVNYVAVDAQQLCDAVIFLHYLWIVPLQAAIALALLYVYLGVSVVAAVIGLGAVTPFVVFSTHINARYQRGLMKKKDERLKATGEVLNHMRAIKFEAWEERFERRILALRSAEFDWLCKFVYGATATMAVVWSTPTIISVLTFGACVLLRTDLNSGKVFTAVALFKTLNAVLLTFPNSLTQVAQAMVSLRRIDTYMNSKEMVDTPVNCTTTGNSPTPAYTVEIRNGSFSWDDEGQIKVLSELNLAVERGSLTAVVGLVGSGKSSLLSAMLGEMTKITGQVEVNGRTAYVAQTAWIQNGTIQENILFGTAMDESKYEEVIKVCCLEKDLEMLEFGDQTEIGERGINLSGGQKQRIQLARAVYQDADIYFLDDIFSAVDAHTGSAIFKDCLKGVLRNKTILLVTHQVDLLHNVDQILVMRDGKIVQSGKYNELLESGADFSTLAASMEKIGKTTSKQEDDSLKHEKHQFKVKSDEPRTEKGSSKLVEDEKREIGVVSRHVYKLFATKALGWWGVVLVIGTSLIWQASLTAGDYWLAFQTSDDKSFKPRLFIDVYTIIAAASLFLVCFRAITNSFMSLKTCQIFFTQFHKSIFHAPMSFFDTTPSGRILSRTSMDQTNLDFLVPVSMAVTLAQFINVLSILVVTCQVAWPTIIILVPLGWLNYWYRKYYLASSRELTRLSSITKAPLLNHFFETVSGATTIRCFGMQQKFCQENLDRLETNLRADFYNYGANEWFGFRLELIASFILCISSVCLVFLPHNVIKPEFVGLSLSYGLSLNTALFMAVWHSCNLENKMVSVERIDQYTNHIASEAEWEIKDCLPYPNWPNQGNIELDNLQARYRPNTPLVLKGISVSIQGGEKIGVVGRTGSGKSTLIQTLFRIVEPSGGKITVDGVDISTLGLHDLRSRFGIIPQEPVLFEGTIRTNVDPTGRHSDQDIWKSLERCQLKDVIAAKPGKLDSSVVDNGNNWSLGQRQLLCLARVMLKKTQILFLDEATASVDSQTDAAIQKIIREDFAACTVVSIAHRIPAVMDCDKVLVIDAGMAREFESPSKLLERPSLFGALVQEYANRSAQL